MPGDAGSAGGANIVVKWLGVAAAIMLGAAGLVEAMKKLDDAYELWTPKPKPVPAFPLYNSPKVGGGYTADQYCAPQRDAYASQYPDFDIVYTVIPATVTFDFLRHAEYVFHCQFIAKRKIK